MDPHCGQRVVVATPAGGLPLYHLVGFNFVIPRKLLGCLFYMETEYGVRIFEKYQNYNDCMWHGGFKMVAIKMIFGFNQSYIFILDI